LEGNVPNGLARIALIAVVPVIVGAGALAPMLKRDAGPEIGASSVSLAAPFRSRNPTAIEDSATAKPVLQESRKVAVSHLSLAEVATPLSGSAPPRSASAPSAAGFPPMQLLTVERSPPVRSSSPATPTQNGVPSDAAALTGRAAAKQKAEKRTAKRERVRPAPFSIRELFASHH
jgi:hypothetical protein